MLKLHLFLLSIGLVVPVRVATAANESTLLVVPPSDEEERPSRYCQPPTKYDYATKTCKPCPSEDVPCSECCNTYGFKCVSGVCLDCFDFASKQCWPDYPTENVPQPTVIYVTASQIALSAALVMGSIALITLLYRICSKPRNRRQPPCTTYPANHPNSAFQRFSQRLSLNSMQIRILQRLRDQPPKYETQHNYDVRIQRDLERQRSANPAPEAEPNSLPSVHTISTGVIVGSAPPAYGEERYSLSDLPPPYSTSAVSATTVPENGNNDPVAGVVELVVADGQSSDNIKPATA